MALSCFRCFQLFNDVQSIMHHYKVFHQVGILDVCSCNQQGCYRHFDDLKALGKHLQSHCNNEDFVHNFNEFDEDHNENDGFIIHDNDNENQEQDVHFNVPGENPNEENAAVVDVNILLEDFVAAVSSSALQFVAKLYADPTLPRCHVQTIIDSTNSFLASGFINILKDKVMNLQPQDQAADLEGFFKILENPFRGLETEHLRFKAFKEDTHLIQPEPCDVGVEDGVENDGGHAQLAPEVSISQFLPMRLVLKNFLELPGVFNDIMHYIQDVESDDTCFKDFLQGEIWRRMKQQYEGKIVLPIFLHGDAYEPDNLNGSHSGDHSIEALYYTLPGIPKQYQAALKNMFIAALLLSAHKKNGNEIIYNRVLDELRFLAENGITINVENAELQVYFALALVLGDNKGVHEMLGFMPSFSANFFCRLCKLHRNLTQRQYHEDVTLLRTVENYANDVALNNPAATGIKSECVFNTIPNYHCIMNPSCDIMHDLLEGVCNYGMGHVLHYFIIVRRYFSSADFCHILKFFDYGPEEQNNKPPSSKFTDERMQSRNISLSSSEMLCLVRYFGLMVGQFIPENEEVWSYFLKLQEIVDFVMAPIFYHGWELYLHTLIEEHHEMYLRYFNDTLKPKHHMMLHYRRLVLLHGPPVHVWSMLCERKHRESKIYARVCLNRINLPFTILMKHSLQLCRRFVSRVGFQKNIVISGDVVHLRDTLYFNFIRDYFQGECDALCTASVESCVVNGTKYHNKSIILYGVQDDMPLFGTILMFICLDRNDVYLVLKKLVTVAVMDHVNSFEVFDSDEFVCVRQSTLSHFHPLHRRTFNNKCCVRLRYMV